MNNGMIRAHKEFVELIKKEKAVTNFSGIEITRRIAVMLNTDRIMQRRVRKINVKDEWFGGGLFS